ncbi:MAG: hypothetical protein C0467_02250 [Planctomycetaceae bacterium]|nr:hypothetical protein [Planctomycetaceae bacterium]
MRLCVPIVALLFGVAAVALPGGCSRKTAGKPTTVRGAVTFQGRPLVGGVVVFTPDPERGSSGKPIRGNVGADGRYELRLTDGIPISPGWYRVALAAPPTLEPTSAVSAFFPPKLARPDMSGLVREVKPEQENVFEFAIEVPVNVATR